MASGHENRASRPNTWLHRPSCKREQNPCQRGAVHTWHRAEVRAGLADDRCQAQSGSSGRHQLGNSGSIIEGTRGARISLIDPRQFWNVPPAGWREEGLGPGVDGL